MNIDDKTKKLIIAVLVLLLLVALTTGEKEPDPPRLKVNPPVLLKTSKVLRFASDELEKAAHTDNMDEHLVERALVLFDAKSKDADFPGPDILTKRLARLAVRPVVLAIIRAATEPEPVTDFPRSNEHVGQTE